MTTIQRYPNLDIVPTEQVLLHEHHDPHRTAPLKHRIDGASMLYNPPIVIPFQGGKYMVLDGANRVTSMKELGLPHLLVQIVAPDSPGLGLRTWNHVIWKISQQELTDAIQEIEAIEMYKSDEKDFSPRDIARIQFYDNGTYKLTADSPGQRSDRITDLVNLYGELARFDRTMIEDIRNLDGLYDQLAGLMIYPHFRVEEVISFCAEGHLLPAGVTRFVVSPRALRVNYPIANLSGDRPLEEKREQLKLFIQERMDKKGVRIYTETTVLYDE